MVLDVPPILVGAKIGLRSGNLRATMAKQGGHGGKIA